MLAGDDDARVLASARCCWWRGEYATINIRWEVGGVRMTKGGVEVDRGAGRSSLAMRWRLRR